MPNLYAYASFHVEHVDKEYATGVKPEVEFQEPEGQYEAADPEQGLEADFTDSFSQQGKPRFILKPSITTLSWVLQLLLYLCIKFIGVVWYLVAWVGFVYPISLISQMN